MRVKLPIAATLAAVMAVSSLGIGSVSAAPAGKLPAAHQNAGAGVEVIQVQNRQKQRARNNRNNAAAAAAFAGIAGAMIGLAAQESRRDRYYRHGYYDGGHRYYGGRTYYRGAPRYYGGGYVRGPQQIPGPQNYGPGAHPPIQNWGLDR